MNIDYLSQVKPREDAGETDEQIAVAIDLEQRAIVGNYRPVASNEIAVYPGEWYDVQLEDGQIYEVKIPSRPAASTINLNSITSYAGASS